MRTDKEPVEFEWDKGNAGKNLKHGVSDYECEETFFDEAKRVLKDALHSGSEERNILLGKTKKSRLLYVVYTKRGKKIRVISARHINRKERHFYEKETEHS